MSSGNSSSPYLEQIQEDYKWHHICSHHRLLLDGPPREIWLLQNSMEKAKGIGKGRGIWERIGRELLNKRYGDGKLNLDKVSVDSATVEAKKG